MDHPYRLLISCKIYLRRYKLVTITVEGPPRKLGLNINKIKNKWRCNYPRRGSNREVISCPRVMGKRNLEILGAAELI